MEDSPVWSAESETANDEPSAKGSGGKGKGSDEKGKSDKGKSWGVLPDSSAKGSGDKGKSWRVLRAPPMKFRHWLLVKPPVASNAPCLLDTPAVKRTRNPTLKGGKDVIEIGAGAAHDQRS